MILVCPLCDSRYLIAASLFADGPRRVRCARCSHSWQVEAELPHASQVPPDNLTPAPETVTPIPEGSNLPAVQKSPYWAQGGNLVLLIIGIILLFFMICLGLMRENIVKEWPSLESLYNKVGLHIYRTGEDITIVDVKSEQRYEEGIMRLFVEGKLVNKTTNIQHVPDLIADAIGPDGEKMQSWQIASPAATLAPSESLAFSSSVKSPQGTIVQINLNFVESKNVPE